MVSFYILFGNVFSFTKNKEMLFRNQNKKQPLQAINSEKSNFFIYTLNLLIKQFELYCAKPKFL